MFLLVLFVYITIITAKKDINDDFYIDTSVPETYQKELDEDEKILFKSRENFTNCEQFLNNTPFDISSALNVSWQAFYFWVDLSMTSNADNMIFNFQLPNPTLIHRFKEMLEREIKNVSWSAAQLFMETNIDFSCILMATNQSGLFGLIPSLALELLKWSTDPLDSSDLEQRMALKFVEPHYLGLMNCRYRQLLALAPVGKMPTEMEVESVAKQFKFKSDYGISLIESQKITREEKKQRQKLFNYEEDDRDLDINYNDPNDKSLEIF